MLHGELEGKTFIKQVYPQHFFRIYHGFGISENEISHVKSLGVDNVVFNYHGKNGLIVYSIPLSDFIYHGKPFYNTPDDLQIVCSTKFMKEK